MAAARREGVEVAIEDLGDWEPASLLSECDRSARSIRINARVIDRLSLKYGDETVQWFIACAVAHEMYHILVPDGNEEDANGFALARTGTSPAAFEAMLDGC